MHSTEAGLRRPQRAPSRKIPSVARARPVVVALSVRSAVVGLAVSARDNLLAGHTAGALLAELARCRKTTVIVRARVCAAAGLAARFAGAVGDVRALAVSDRVAAVARRAGVAVNASMLSMRHAPAVLPVSSSAGVS